MLASRSEPLPALKPVSAVTSLLGTAINSDLTRWILPLVVLLSGHILRYGMVRTQPHCQRPCYLAPCRPQLRPEYQEQYSTSSPSGLCAHSATTYGSRCFYRRPCNIGAELRHPETQRPPGRTSASSLYDRRHRTGHLILHMAGDRQLHPIQD